MSIPTKTNLLTQQEELFLIRMTRSASMKNEVSKGRQDWAMRELVCANLGLVHKICHRFPIKNASCGYDDLFQEGVGGLIHGINKFEEERGYRLSTYCYRWIQAYVSRYFQNQGKTIRIPVHLATQEMKNRKEIESLTRDLGHTPSQSELKAYGIDVPQHTECVSLNVIVGEGEELECFAGEDVTDQTDNRLEVEMLLNRLDCEVSDRDLNMFIHRYGLRGKREHTLNEIADFHGITRARVHQVTNNCLRQLQEMVTNDA